LEDRDEAGRSGVEGELVLVDGELLDVLGETGGEVLTVLVQGGGEREGFGGWVYGEFFSKRSLGTGSYVGCEVQRERIRYV
jgi:hypothetical protein